MICSPAHPLHLSAAAVGNRRRPRELRSEVEGDKEPQSLNFFLRHSFVCWQESIILAPVDINNPAGLKAFQDQFKIQLPLIELNYSYASQAYDDAVRDVRRFYFGDKPVNADSLQEFVKLLSDVFFVYGIDKAVKVQAKRSSGLTFYYQ